MALEKCTLKLVVIGESEVGKTSLLRRMTDHAFFENVEQTMNISFRQVDTEIDNIPVRLNIWDTVGHERHHAVTNNYYRNADAALLVYDVNQPKTLKALDYWSSELDLHSNGCRVIKVLVGNKMDLVPPDAKPSVKSGVSSAWAADRSIGSSLQTSAKTGHNVALAFEAAIRLTTKFQNFESRKTLPKDPIRKPRRNEVSQKSSKKCCYIL
ncbi:Ras-related protein RABA5a [Halotydeus destructor]|nr:Ras-related protein RABA5a [Halotydeus destructor]